LFLKAFDFPIATPPLTRALGEFLLTFVALGDGPVLECGPILSLSFDHSPGDGVKVSLLHIVADVIIVSFNQKSETYDYNSNNACRIFISKK
jgi:hypothetical protein